MHYIIILAFAIFGISTLVSTCNKDHSSPSRPDAAISVTVTRGSDGFITIRNEDGFDWNNVRLYLNSEYEARYPRVPAGEEASVSAADFTTKNGTRFNPYATKALSLVITADTPNGRAASEVRWQ